MLLRLRQAETILPASRGAMGIRTPDLLNAIEALYQLSYDPFTEFSLERSKEIMPQEVRLRNSFIKDNLP